MITTYERGMKAGERVGQLDVTLRQLEAKFGQLAPEVKARVESLSPEDLQQLQLNLLKTLSLNELGLVD